MSKKENKASIYYVRKAKRLHQKDLAAKMGIHPVTLCRLENYRFVPSHDLAVRVGRVTKQSAGQVIDEYAAVDGQRRRAS